MTEQEIEQARADMAQLDIEQLRCGVMLQLLKIDALTKERDTALEQNTVLDAHCAKLEAERDALAVSRYAYASEFSLDEEGQPDVGSIHQNIRALKAAGKLALDVCLDMRRYGDQRSVAMAIGADAALRQAGVHVGG